MNRKDYLLLDLNQLCLDSEALTRNIVNFLSSEQLEEFIVFCGGEVKERD